MSISAAGEAEMLKHFGFLFKYGAIRVCLISRESCAENRSLVFKLSVRSSSAQVHGGLAAIIPEVSSVSVLGGCGGCYELGRQIFLGTRGRD